jgi:hypothetical protein
MIVRNLLTQTTPAVLHRNGNPPDWRPHWPGIVDAFFAEAHRPCDPVPELTVITWNNLPEKSLLERCLDVRGIPHLVLGKQVTRWRPFVKLFLNAEALAHIDTEYVMGLDGSDVLMVGCPRRVLAAFKAMDCDILFSSERNSYPKAPFLYEFEKSIGEGPYRHLNSGAWIGRTEVCRRFFEECVKEDNSDILAAHPAKHVVADDQGVTRKVFRRYYPAARMDYRCELFQSMFKVPVEGELSIDAGTIADDSGSSPRIDAARAAVTVPPKTSGTLETKLAVMRDRLVAERAESSFLRQLQDRLRERLTQAETGAVAGRRLVALFGGHEERIAGQIAHGARRLGVPPAGESLAPTVFLGLPWRGTPSVDPQRLVDDIALVRQFVVGGVMLDIGAGTGETSIPRVLAGDFHAAYAAESDEAMFESLGENVRTCGLTNRVIADRAAIGGFPGEPRALTLDAWLDRLNVPRVDVRFVRLVVPAQETVALEGAASLLDRRDIVWQLIVGPREDARALGRLLASHFARIRAVDAHDAATDRPSADAVRMLRECWSEGRAANLLLHNVG